MESTHRLGGAERRVWRSYWQDGLLDALSGAAIALIGVGWLGGLAAAPAIVPPVVLVSWPVLRRSIVEPRLGRVEFAPARRHDLRHGVVAVLSLGIVLGFLVASRIGAAEEPGALVRWLAPALPALLLALLAVSSSLALRLQRFLAHGATLVTAGVVVAALDVGPGWALAGAGVVIAASGLVLLRRFLREFPRLPAHPE